MPPSHLSPPPGTACPANSYYDFCGPPCPATCAGLNSSTPCTRQCTAGCFCLEGFALEAGVCVPLAHCGCHLQGRYIPLGAEVLPTATCDQKCVCRGPGQPLECRPHACGRREQCRQRQGVWGCHPMRFGTMWLYGDPHLRTFDGTHHHIRGPGRKLLVRTCRPHHAPFAIWVEIRHLKPWAATWAQQVDVDVAGWQLSLLAGQFGMVQVSTTSSSPASWGCSGLRGGEAGSSCFAALKGGKFWICLWPPGCFSFSGQAAGLAVLAVNTVGTQSPWTGPIWALSCCWRVYGPWVDGAVLGHAA